MRASSRGVAAAASMSMCESAQAPERVRAKNLHAQLWKNGGYNKQMNCQGWGALVSAPEELPAGRRVSLRARFGYPMIPHPR